MSNFQTLSPVTAGLPGTAPLIFCAVTTDDLATITAVGYLNDLDDKVKLNDVFFVNHDDTGLTSTLGRFRVDVAGSDKSLVAFA